MITNNIKCQSLLYFSTFATTILNNVSVKLTLPMEVHSSLPPSLRERKRKERREEDRTGQDGRVDKGKYTYSSLQMNKQQGRRLAGHTYYHFQQFSEISISILYIYICICICICIYVCVYVYVYAYVYIYIYLAIANLATLFTPYICELEQYSQVQNRLFLKPNVSHKSLYFLLYGESVRNNDSFFTLVCMVQTVGFLFMWKY